MTEAQYELQSLDEVMSSRSSQQAIETALHYTAVLSSSSLDIVESAVESTMLLRYLVFLAGSGNAVAQVILATGHTEIFGHRTTIRKLLTLTATTTATATATVTVGDTGTAAVTAIDTVSVSFAISADDAVSIEVNHYCYLVPVSVIKCCCCSLRQY